MTEFQNRQNWDLDAWPEMYDDLKVLLARIFISPPDFELNMMSSPSLARHRAIVTVKRTAPML